MVASPRRKEPFRVNRMSSSRLHWWFGVTAVALLPVLVVFLALTQSLVVLLALVLDGSVVARFAAELWRARERGRQ